MIRRSALLVPLICVLATLESSAAELKNLKGQTITGDVTSITEKEIILTSGGKAVKTPLDQVLTLETAPPFKIPADSPTTQIELVDGTILLGKNLLIKKSQATFTLLSSDKETVLPVAAIDNILHNAQDANLRKLWRDLTSAKRERDSLVVYRDGILNPLVGTLGEGSEDGTKIEFTLASGAGGKRELPVTSGAGLIFFRVPNPLAPPTTLRLSDTGGNLLMVNKLTFKDDNLEATTSSGVTMTVPRSQLAKLDFSKGRQTYLSDMTPSRKVLESASGPRFAQLLLDKNLNNTGTMRLKGEAFSKGLAMFTYTELEYDLGRDYNEFRAVGGIDDEVGGADGSVHLLIEGDGRELLSLTFSRQDKVRAQPITLNIRDVSKLRIVVSDPDGKDIGKHLNLANAQVTK